MIPATGFAGETKRCKAYRNPPPLSKARPRGKAGERGTGRAESGPVSDKDGSDDKTTSIYFTIIFVG